MLFISVSYGVFPQEREVQSQTQIWVSLPYLLLTIVSYLNK